MTCPGLQAWLVQELRPLESPAQTLVTFSHFCPASRPTSWTLPPQRSRHKTLHRRATVSRTNGTFPLGKQPKGLPAKVAPNPRAVAAVRLRTARALRGATERKGSSSRVPAQPSFLLQSHPERGKQVLTCQPRKQLALPWPSCLGVTGTGSPASL